MCRKIRSFFTAQCLWGVALLALTAAVPTQAWAQAQHGIGITKNCVDPRGGEPGVVVRGETVTNNITVTNLDTAGHAIRVDSITDVIAGTNSGNLLASPVTLPTLGSTTTASFQYTVQATDPLGALTDTASASGVDLGTSGNVTASTEASCTVVECIVDTDCPPTDLVCGVAVCVANECVVQPAPSSTICRESAGPCDLEESCPGGESTECPTDAFQPSSTPCSESTGVCDVPESCPGDSAECPANGFQPSSTSCNAELCQTCPGTSAECPTTDICPRGEEGCTPGFFKNNAVNKGATQWVGFSPTQTVASVFTIPGCLSGCNLGSQTLLQALSFGGGSGNCGAARNLLRAAVAALLNAANPDVESPNTVSEVIAETNAALASCTRGDILDLASDLDADNNLGCPLSQN